MNQSNESGFPVIDAMKLSLAEVYSAYNDHLCKKGCIALIIKEKTESSGVHVLRVYWGLSGVSLLRRRASGHEWFTEVLRTGLLRFPFDVWLERAAPDDEHVLLRRDHVSIRVPKDADDQIVVEVLRKIYHQ